MLYFAIENARGELEKNLTCEAGCGLTVLWSDYARIMVGLCSDRSRIGPALEMTFHLFSNILSEISQCNFVWQAQYLVMLEGEACCSAHCK